MDLKIKLKIIFDSSSEKDGKCDRSKIKIIKCLSDINVTNNITNKVSN